MNYEKKRKRQSGRQKRNEPKYRSWIDEFDRAHAEIEQLKKTGELPEIDFGTYPVKVYKCGELQG